MKSSELHRLVKKAGWKLVRVSGSHHIYEKNGQTIVVPFHGAKEVPEPLRKSIAKQAGL